MTMNTKDEALRVERALKLALEALERLKLAFFKNAPDGIEQWESDWVVPSMNAIAAIREALAEPSEALSEQPAQQEPVAWVVEDQYGERLEWAEVAHIGWGWKKLPLYTSPPASKPWVGLTDDEIDELDRKNYGFPQPVAWRGPFARAVEAKLRERNEHGEKNV